MSKWAAKRAAVASEHVMFKDSERRKIVCAKCGLPWPCQTKVDEILAKIKRDKLEAQ
jgi:hypothetical protein